MKSHLIALLLVALFSCTPQPSDEFAQSLRHTLEEKAQENEIYGFKVPDSLDRSLIVAVYYDLHQNSHSVIVYSDTGKTKAIHLRYAGDSLAQLDHLLKTSHNEFKSRCNNVEYRVSEKSVRYSYVNGSTSFGTEHIRIE